MQREISDVYVRLRNMREDGVWPGRRRHLWTDAFGVILLVSLHRTLGDPQYLEQAEEVVAEVERKLSQNRGIASGEDYVREGQRFHHLAMWVYALSRLGAVHPRHRARAVALVRDIHRSFVIPGVGIFAKMREDLSAPSPGVGFGMLEPFHGYVAYRMLAPDELAREISELRALIAVTWRTLSVVHEQGLGLMLWLSHFFPNEPWAQTFRRRALSMLEPMWVERLGFFRRDGGNHVGSALANYAVSIGLQAVGGQTRRVQRLEEWFGKRPAVETLDGRALTQVLACCSRFPGELLIEGIAANELALQPRVAMQR